MKSPRICFYGNFGAGNLGNEATLQAVIEQVLQCWPDGQLLCFCTNPQDVRARHHIAALPAQAINRTASEMSDTSAPPGRLMRFFRIAFERILAKSFTGSNVCTRSAAPICLLSPGPESFVTTRRGRRAIPMTYSNYQRLRPCVGSN